MDELLNGYRRFRRDTWPEQRARFEELAERGQRPRALLVACIDSRVDPAVILGAGPGELLTLRNVANLVPPYAPDSQYHGTSAGLEFGVRVLNIPEIVVMGHALCGGIAALIDGAPPEAADFVSPWIGIARPARERALACDDPVERQLTGERESIRLSLGNLRTFPWIAEREAKGDLRLTGAHFDIRTGTLVVLDADGEFRPVPTEPAVRG